MTLPVAHLATAGAAFGAAFWLAWTIQGAKIDRTVAKYESREAQYQTRLAESLAEAQKERERLHRQSQEALDERDAEIERLAALAERIPDTIRVRVPVPCPVPASADGVPGTAEGGDPAGGVLHEGTAALDIGSLRRLAERADRVTADLRAVVRACSPTTP